MDDSDSSSLSSLAPEEEVQKLAPIFIKARKATKAVAPPPKATPPRPKRPPSPPHDDVFADNSDIAFIVMFRSRFSAAFPPRVAHFGPQDVERAVETSPNPQAESLLCALLGLVLNRKKPVEQGHYTRALEEAIQTHKSQWPLKWQGKSPLAGQQDFTSMTSEQKLNLLRTLILWSLNSSEEISAIIRNNYKQNRHNDDENQPLSVQPWGRDGDKRRYFLVEGQDDTSFRVYREGQRTVKNIQWFNMAGDIEEVKTLAHKLENDDGSQAARLLSGRMLAAIPRFEATEEKRRRREYRQLRKAQFERPEPGFTLYKGRTRAKRMRYTFDDDEAFLSDATSTRRSARHSERDTPIDDGPVTTLSGRQIKPRRGGEYGASLLSGQTTNYGTPEYDEAEGTDGSDVVVGGRARRAAARTSLNANGKRRYVDEYDPDNDMSEDDAAQSDGWDSEANEQEDEEMPDADEEEDDEDLDIEEEEVDELHDGTPRSLIVKLKVRHKRAVQPPSNTTDDRPSIDVGMKPEDETKSIPAAVLDTPTQVHAPAVQLSLSGYPTPASLASTNMITPAIDDSKAVQPPAPISAQVVDGDKPVSSIDVQPSKADGLVHQSYTAV